MTKSEHKVFQVAIEDIKLDLVSAQLRAYNSIRDCVPEEAKQMCKSDIDSHLEEAERKIAALREIYS